MALMSVREYAKHRGVQLRAISFALERGRITRTPEGFIDSDQADRDWEKNTNHRMSEAAKRNGAVGQAMRRRQAQQIEMPERAAVTGSEAGSGEGKVPPDSPSDIGAFAKARAIRERYAAMILKLDYEERSGKLISRAEVETTAFNRDRILRDLVLAVPDRICAELAAEENAANVHRVLEAELRSVLDKVAEMKTVPVPRRSVPLGNVG